MKKVCIKFVMPCPFNNLVVNLFYTVLKSACNSAFFDTFVIKKNCQING
jgi:hypothetical protein